MHRLYLGLHRRIFFRQVGGLLFVLRAAKVVLLGILVWVKRGLVFCLNTTYPVRSVSVVLVVS